MSVDLIRAKTEGHARIPLNLTSAAAGTPTRESIVKQVTEASLSVT